MAIGLGARNWTSGGQFYGLLIIKSHVSQPCAASGVRGAAFEPPRSRHQRVEVLWIVARPVQSPESRWAAVSL